MIGATPVPAMMRHLVLSRAPLLGALGAAALLLMAGQRGRRAQLRAAYEAVWGIEIANIDPGALTARGLVSRGRFEAWFLRGRIERALHRQRWCPVSPWGTR